MPAGQSWGGVAPGQGDATMVATSPFLGWRVHTTYVAYRVVFTLTLTLNRTVAPILPGPG